ncbi:hypothetical protein SUGI_1225900 [Cryptomeria japonica]|uniref:Uncharacterized protein n=1 Tax=Cryptomeria japonica TaxID=3369 RepID=A0AAD3NPZ4_CRYJA|nr:hypothetical protein SUGI_1225900 [Cryptomeria japonica]
MTFTLPNQKTALQGTRPLEHWYHPHQLKLLKRMPPDVPAKNERRTEPAVLNRLVGPSDDVDYVEKDVLEEGDALPLRGLLRPAKNEREVGWASPA